jgi:hypothetical protein
MFVSFSEEQILNFTEKKFSSFSSNYLSEGSASKSKEAINYEHCILSVTCHVETVF